MANQVVELLFGVQGGASINGQSGRRIREDILGIVQDLKGTKYTQIEFSASQSSLTKLREDIEKALKDVHVTFAAEVKGGITDGSKSGNSGSGGEKNGEKETKKRIKELKATQNEVLKLMSIYRDFYKWQGDALGAGGPTDLDKQNKLLDKSQQKFEQAETVLKKYSWSAEQLAEIDSFITQQEEKLTTALAQHEKAQESLSEATKQGLKEQQEQSTADKQRIKDLNDLFNLYKRAAGADMDAQYSDDPREHSRYVKEGNKLLEQANTLRQRLNLTEKEALEIEERLSKTGYEFTTLGGKYVRGFQAQADAAQRAAAAMEHLDASDDEMVDDAQRTIAIIARIQKQLLAFDNLSHKQSVISALDPQDLAAFQAEANAVGEALKGMGVDAAVADIQLGRVGDDGQLQDLLIKINNLVLGLRNATGQASGLATANVKLETSYHKLANRAHDYMVRIQGSLSRDPGMMQEMQNLVDRLHRGDFESVAHGAQEFQKLQFRIKQAGLEAETFGEQVRRVFKEKFGFGVMATAAMYARSAISDVARTVVDLDTKLTELKIVSGATGQAMAKYFDDAAAAAKRVASSITDIIDATTVYRRLGFEMSKSLDFAELTTMYSKVGAVDMSQAEENITAIIKAYNLEDINELRYALDQMVATGNNLPISASGLGQALNNAASSLTSAGNNFQESLALITASNTITQDPDKASTALRTISARLRQSTVELEDLGEELDETYNTVSSYQAKFKSLTGVDILEEDQKTYKSTYQILKELSEVWETLSEMDKQAVTYMAAGIRQGNVFSSIMTEFADAEKTLKVTAEAAGSMQSAYENYIDSIQGRLNTLTASSQELFNNLLDSDLIKGGVSAVTALVEALNSLIETIGLLPTIGAGVGLYKLISSVGGAKLIALINAPTYVPVVTRSELAA